MTQEKITVEYARKKLGKKGEVATDEQLQELLTMLRTLCDKTIDSVIKE